MDALSGYTIIRTNTGAKTPQEAVNRSQVVLLGEIHGFEELSDSEKANDLVINRFFRKGDSLLTEGNDGGLAWKEKRRLVKALKGICKANDSSPEVNRFFISPKDFSKLWLPERGYSKLAQRSWDISVYHKLTWGRRSLGYQLLYKCGQMCRLARLVHSGNKLDSKAEGIYLHLAGMLQRRGATLKETWKLPERAIKELLLSYADIVKRIREESLANDTKGIFWRNVSMLQNILAYKGKGRVFVTTGAGHIRYAGPKHAESINALYQGLEKRSVRYVVLQPPKCPGPSELGKDGIAFLEKAHAEILMGHKQGLKERISRWKTTSPTLVFKKLANKNEKDLPRREKSQLFCGHDQLAKDSQRTGILVEALIDYTWPKSKL